MSEGDKGHWKPCQRGTKLLCTSLLHLQEHYLEDRGYGYLMLARFTQDCIENLISMIRPAQATPHALAFVQSLKSIAMSQYALAVKGSSNDHDEGGHLINFMAQARMKAGARLAEKKVLAKAEASDWANWDKTRECTVRCHAHINCGETSKYFVITVKPLAPLTHQESNV